MEEVKKKGSVEGVEDSIYVDYNTRGKERKKRLKVEHRRTERGIGKFYKKKSFLSIFAPPPSVSPLPLNFSVHP